MIYYKIYNPTLAKYSNGRAYITWSVTGKVWTSKKNLDLHLKMLRDNHPEALKLYTDNNCRIIGFRQDCVYNESINDYM